MVYELMNNLQALGARMSTKIHFLNSHLNYFPENCGDYSEEQGKPFHQDICTMEERYHGPWNIIMLADYCWCFKRDIPVLQHKKKLENASLLVFKSLFVNQLLNVTEKVIFGINV